MLTRSRIAEVIQEVAPKYDISDVYLFGSYARGDATEDSDCDFRIVGGNIRNLYDVSGLRIDLVEALGKEVDLVFTDSIKSTFYDEIKEEEVLIYAKAK
jgi:predicted nucleotidyltransferase